MLLDAAAARSLAAIVLTNTQGADQLTPQLPLHVEDRGDLWLVKGTPFDDKKLQLRYCQFHIFFRKTNAEIRGIGFDIRQEINASQAAYWNKMLGPRKVAWIFGPAKVFEPGGPDFEMMRTVYQVGYGGFINLPSAAVDYAHILMEASGSRLGNIPKDSLRAEEVSGTWHVTVTHAPGFTPNGEILSLSRTTGKLLSGGL